MHVTCWAACFINTTLFIFYLYLPFKADTCPLLMALLAGSLYPPTALSQHTGRTLTIGGHTESQGSSRTVTVALLLAGACCEVPFGNQAGLGRVSPMCQLGQWACRVPRIDMPALSSCAPCAASVKMQYLPRGKAQQRVCWAPECMWLAGLLASSIQPFPF